MTRWLFPGERRSLPLIPDAGFDTIWFGVFFVLVVEIAQITPPAGFNLFSTKGLTGEKICLIAWATFPLFLIMVALAFRPVHAYQGLHTPCALMQMTKTMSTDPHAQNRQAIAAVSAEMYDFNETGVRRALDRLFKPDATVHVCEPFGTMIGPEALYETVFAPLLAAVPDLERRDYIRVAGNTEHSGHWVGTAGYYTGVKVTPWLDIPPIGHQVFVRAHEFYRFEHGRVVEAQILWDIPAVMMQAGAWPMVPSLGLEFHVPGPSTQDGLLTGPRDPDQSDASCKLIVDMLSYMKRHPSQGGPEVMEMDRFWHPRMNWYGPGGIGTGRGIAGFRNWHQIPWLSGMPDRGQYLDEITYHFFGDANYAAVTGWPNMVQTLTHPGFLGLPPTGQKFTSRSLDFWRIEAGRIRENWVMVDMIDIYAQLGVDVFARLREFNKARNLGPVPWDFRAN